MSTWIMILLCIAGGLFAVKLLFLIATGCALPITRGALYIPTASIRIEAFLESVPMSSKDLFVDLGCGDGRVLRAAHRRYGVRALGFEVNPLAYFTARLRSLGIHGVQIRWGNFWPENLSQANVVFCYLFPDVMGSLARKLALELQPNSRIVSCNFPLPCWEPIEVLHPDSARHGDPIYLYRLPDSCHSSVSRNPEEQ